MWRLGFLQQQFCSLMGGKSSTRKLEQLRHTHTHSWKAHALSDHCPPLGCEGGFTWVHKPSTANSDKSRQIEFFAPNFFFNVSTFYVPLKSSSQSFTGLVNWGESAISSAVSRGILSPLSSFARKCALFRIVRAKG